MYLNHYRPTRVALALGAPFVLSRSLVSSARVRDNLPVHLGGVIYDLGFLDAGPHLQTAQTVSFQTLIEVTVDSKRRH